MKIGFFTELFYPHIGGTEKRFYELGKRLANLGHDVHVFTLRYDKGLPKESEHDGIQIHRYAYAKNYITPKGRRTLTGTFKYSLETAIKAYKSELDVYYFNQWPILHSILAKPFISKMVYDWCEVWYDEITVLEKIIKKITNCHVAVSDFTKRRLVDFLSIPQETITVVPNGVEFKQFENNSTSRDWGKIVYVGRMYPHKHLDLTIEAFYQLKKNMPDAELHLIGTGPMMPTLQKMAEKSSGIYLHGHLPDSQVLEMLKKSWLFVTSSDREGSGIAALEAMASGLPVVTLNFENNAITEYAAEGCCLSVEPNPSSLASCIQSLSSDEKLWNSLSNKATEYSKCFDWDNIVYDFESFLKRII